VSRKPHILALEKGSCGRGGLFGDGSNYVGEVVGRDVSGADIPNSSSSLLVVVFLGMILLYVR
jgi:hypothetical protein